MTTHTKAVNFKARDHLGDLVIGGRILLEWILDHINTAMSLQVP